MKTIYLQAIGGDLGALGTVDERLPDLADLEDGRRLDVVPVLLAEGVHAARTVCAQQNAKGWQMCACARNSADAISLPFQRKYWRGASH